jgi:hypothetical protein
MPAAPLTAATPRPPAGPVTSAGLTIVGLVAALSTIDPVVVGPGADRAVRVGWAVHPADRRPGAPVGIVVDLRPDAAARFAPIGPPAELPACDLVFTAGEADIVSALLRLPVDPTAARRVIVDDTGGGGRSCGPLPPFRPRQRTVVAERVASIAGTVRAQLLLTRSPFGGIPGAVAVADGRVVELQPGQQPAADVHASLPYERYLRLCLGELSVAQAVRDGDVAGTGGAARAFTDLLGVMAQADAAIHARCGLAALTTCTAVLASDRYRSWARAVRRLLGTPGLADQP